MIRVMLDYLFVGAHSDDCEMFAGGTMLHLKSLRQKIGILDLTASELGSLGDRETRKKEAEKAKFFLGLDYRETLDLMDGNIIINLENLLKVVKIIRKTKPNLMVTFHKECRHPDHERTHELVKQAFFLSGLKKIHPSIPAFKPHNLFYFMDFPYKKIPSFVIDITKFYQNKINLIKLYSSQVKTDPIDDSNETFIHSDNFWRALEGTNLYHGSLIGCLYGEGFINNNVPRVVNPLDNFKRNFI